MKVFTNILKVLTALAAVAGVVFVVAEYGDKIVAWAKELKERISSYNKCNIIEFTPAEEDTEEVPSEEAAPAAEVPAEEPAAEPVEAPEAPAADGEPVAEEEDFEA